MTKTMTAWIIAIAIALALAISLSLSAQEPQDGYQYRHEPNFIVFDAPGVDGLGATSGTFGRSINPVGAASLQDSAR